MRPRGTTISARDTASQRPGVRSNAAQSGPANNKRCAAAGLAAALACLVLGSVVPYARARAEGLGMGWVSIFDPDRLGELLGLPDEAQAVAVLCLGPVPNFPDRPALEIDQWAQGRPLAEFLSENAWR